MNQQPLTGIDAIAAPSDQQEMTHRRTEWGRKAILSGCVIAMVGMVTYCYGTLGGGPEADLFSSLFQNGILGWTALLFLLLGVGVWLAGNLVLLSEQDRASTGTPAPNSSERARRQAAGAQTNQQNGLSAPASLSR